MHNQLRAIYNRILEFEALAARIHEEAVAEREARVARMAAHTREGEYGTLGEGWIFSKNKIGSAKAQLRIVCQSMIRTFLFQLACSPD